MPGVPCDWLSDTAMVLNGNATPPAAATAVGHVVGQRELVEVARHRPRPGRRDAHDRPVEAARVDAQRAEVSPRARPLRTARELRSSPCPPRYVARGVHGTANANPRHGRIAVGMGATPDHEVVIVGAGFSGHRRGDQARQGRHPRLRRCSRRATASAAPGTGTPIRASRSTSRRSATSSRSSSAPDWSRVYAPGRRAARPTPSTASTSTTCARASRLNTRGRRRGVRRRRAPLAADDRATATSSPRASSIGATGVLHASRSRPTSPASTTSPARRCTPRAGTTTSDLRGKRVAVIGTGASAVQVIPSIAAEVEQLTVFQRTPIWCLPKLDAPTAGALRAALRWLPGARWRGAARSARRSSS